jgi:hypothetical protein
VRPRTRHLFDLLRLRADQTLELLLPRMLQLRLLPGLQQSGLQRCPLYLLLCQLLLLLPLLLLLLLLLQLLRALFRLYLAGKLR